MEPTLPDHAARTPDKPAYIMAGSGMTVSYRELNEHSNQCAQLFRKLGLRPGDHIAFYLENHSRFLEICWACVRSGLYYTAINSHLNAAEAAYIVEDCGAKLFIASVAGQDIAAALSDDTPGVRYRLMLDGATEGYDSYELAVSDQPTQPIADEIQGVDMLYSSGTTGRPKGIKRPLQGQPFGTRDPALNLITGLYGMDENAIYLSPAPLYHAAPLRFNMTAINIGATCVIMERFDAEQALSLAQTYRATHSQWVPTMFVRMLKLPEATRLQYDMSAMRVAIHAAAPCPVPVKEQMIGWWGPILQEYYAGTEGNGFCSIDSAEWLRHKGAVGKALVGIIHIVDDDGNELPTGEPGTIYFADGNPFVYHNDPEKTAQSRNDKGWTTLGDVGYLDDEGYLYLTDRKAHMIISGGVNIYPQEIENLLVTHDAVLDVAVIGVPNEEFGEEVKAVVQPVAGIETGPTLEQALIAFCRDNIAAFKAPRSVDFVDALPRLSTGKLYKRLLKERYWPPA